MEAAQASRSAGKPNARFIVLDPNGEYARAFGAGDLKAKIFRVNPEPGAQPLQVPLWFWNAAEWTSFTKASAKTQRPTLVQALRFARDENIEFAESANHSLRRFLRTVVVTIRAEKNAGGPWGPFPRPKAFYQKLEK